MPTLINFERSLNIIDKSEIEAMNFQVYFIKRYPKNYKGVSFLIIILGYPYFQPKLGVLIFLVTLLSLNWLFPA